MQTSKYTKRFWDTRRSGYFCTFVHIRIFVIAIFVLSYVFVFSYEAQAARLYFYPQNTDVLEGDSYITEVRINTEGETVNAVDISGAVGGGVIESVESDSSLVKIFIEASSSEESFRFAGGTPGGFSGEGVIGRLHIRAPSAGVVSISFDENPRIASGEGESVKLKIVAFGAGATVSKKTADHIELSSRSHPDENKWYSKEDLHIHWTLEEGVEYSYLISRNLQAEPDDSLDQPEGELEWQGDIEIRDLDDGIFYFTVKRIGGNDISRRRAMIDTTAPRFVFVEASEGVPETREHKFISFLAEDAVSGIDRYEVSINGGTPEQAVSPYVIPDTYKSISITAYDKAGNSKEKILLGVASGAEKSVAALYAIVGLMAIAGIVVFVPRVRRFVFREQNGAQNRN